MKGFVQVGCYSVPASLIVVTILCLGRQDEYRQGAIERISFQYGREFYGRHVRQGHIEDNKVRPLCLKHSQTFRSVQGLKNVIT